MFGRRETGVGGAGFKASTPPPFPPPPKAFLLSSSLQVGSSQFPDEVPGQSDLALSIF